MHPYQVEMFAREKLADRLRSAERARSAAEAYARSMRRGEAAQRSRAERPVPPAHAREEAA